METAPESDVLGFVDLWRSQAEMEFAEWVRTVADEFAMASLSLESAAKLAHVTTAELQGVLSLASLEDEELEVLTSAPPKTTWFLFADAGPDAIRAGVEALTELGPKQSAYAVVSNAMHEATGPTVEERVEELPRSDLRHAAKKAEQYDLLNKRAISFLKSVDSAAKRDKVLTPPQMSWAISLLNQLADADAISRESSDGDQETCDRVLNAIDR